MPNASPSSQFSADSSHQANFTFIFKTGHHESQANSSVFSNQFQTNLSIENYILAEFLGIWHARLI